jgi:hypothetical protein
MITSPARAVATGLWFVAFALVPPAALAQTEQEPATRAETLRVEREQKAQETRPHEQNRVERGMHFFEDRAVFILDREGF